MANTIIDRIIVRADGVPLFIEELTKSVLEAGASIDDPVADDAVPATLQASLVARLDRLGDAKNIAQVGAVIGRQFSHDLLAAVAEKSKTEVNAALDRLVESELVFRRGSPPDAIYTFKHALVQDAAYDSLLFSRRRELHARVVNALERLHRGPQEDHAELLAYHAQRGVLWDKALIYYGLAGRKANERSAYKEAIGFLEAGLEVIGHLPESEQTTRQGIDIRLDLRPGLGATGQYERIFDTLSEAEALAQSIDDRRTAAVIGVDKTHVLYQRGYLEEAMETGRGAVELARELDDVRLQIGASANLGMAHFFHGDFHLAAEIAGEHAERLKREFRHERLGTTGTSSSHWLGNLAGMHALLGEFDIAMGYGEEACGIADETEKPFDVAMSGTWLGFVLTTAGRLREATDRLELSLKAAEENDLAFLAPWAANHLGCAYALTNQPEKANAILLSASRQAEKLGLLLVYIWCLNSQSLASLEAREFADAVRHAKDALHLARHHKTEWLELLAMQRLGAAYAGMDAGRPGEAKRFLLQAVELAKRLAARPDLAHCQRLLGELYRKQRCEQDARRQLSAASDLYRSMGMTFWLSRTEALLANESPMSG